MCSTNEPRDLYHTHTHTHTRTHTHNIYVHTHTLTLPNRSRVSSRHSSSARPRNPLSFVQAAHQHIWRSCHLLHKIRRSHCSPQLASQFGGRFRFLMLCSLQFSRRKAFFATPLVVAQRDMRLEKWSGGKGLAIDVAVTSPLAATYVRKQEPCES